MPLKITIFYNQASGGFTETWYANGTEPPDHLTTGVQSILKRAIKFRAPLTYIYAVRFSVVDSPRKSILFKVGQYAMKADVSPAPDQNRPDVVSTTAQYRIRDSNFNWRMLEIRGLADNSILRDDLSGVPNPQTGFLKGVEAYLNMVYNAGWYIRVAKKQSVGGLTQTQVISMQPNPLNENQTEILLTDNLNLQVPGFTKIRFYGVIKNDLPGFPTTATLNSKTIVFPFKVVIPYRMRGTAIYQPVNMRALPSVYEYFAIADYSFWNFTRRDTGRPTGSQRGRARGAVRAQ